MIPIPFLILRPVTNVSNSFLLGGNRNFPEKKIEYRIVYINLAAGFGSGPRLASAPKKRPAQKAVHETANIGARQCELRGLEMRTGTTRVSSAE